MAAVYLYSPYWSSFGGGEKYSLSLAVALSKSPGLSVTILACGEPVEKKALGDFFGIDLSPVRLLNLADEPAMVPSVKKTDVFVSLANFKAVETPARVCVQLLQIPYGTINPLSIMGRVLRGQFKEAAKDVYRLRLFAYARHKATLVVTNSRFVHDTLKRNFGVESNVLHPPIGDFLDKGMSKKKVILSVGRFFTGLYNDKRYDILTRAFRDLYDSGFRGWDYHVAGSLPADKTSKTMFRKLQEENKGYPIHFHDNAPFETVRTLFNEATIFWHAAGFGSDDVACPERAEHFGMTTAEAMSARCIPVVINKGGQKEIVQPGVDGFLWNSVEELIETTRTLANERPSRLDELRNNARHRSREFGIERFDNRVAEIFSPILRT